MSRAEKLANELVERLTDHDGADIDKLTRFDAVHRLIFHLRQLPQTLVLGTEDSSQLSDLPSEEAEMLFALVDEIGPAQAGAALFIAAVHASQDL